MTGVTVLQDSLGPTARPPCSVVLVTLARMVLPVMKPMTGVTVLQDSLGPTARPACSAVLLTLARMVLPVMKPMTGVTVLPDSQGAAVRPANAHQSTAPRTVNQSSLLTKRPGASVA